MESVTGPPPKRFTEARIVSQHSMLYTDGIVSQDLDRPKFVRAASSIQQLDVNTFIVFQDDNNFVGIVDLSDRAKPHITSITLPAVNNRRDFSDERKNKSDKMDTEASIRVFVDQLPLALQTRYPQGWIVGFGSGSKAKKRREAVIVAADAQVGGKIVARVVPLPELYTLLDDTLEFSTSELNIEGAVFLGDRVRFVSRGNGHKRDIPASDAYADVAWPDLLPYLLEERSAPLPPLAVTNVRKFDLGKLQGVKLTATDVTCFPSQFGGSRRPDFLIGVASAEDSANAAVDGQVTGSMLFTLHEDAVTHLVPLKTSDQKNYAGKVEGVVILPNSSRALLTVDMDDIHTPSLLLEVELLQ